MEAIPLLPHDAHDDVFQIDLGPDTETTASESEQYLIFFVPGNPGLPKFYTGFLENLAAFLKGSSTSTPKSITIRAAQLAGFQGSCTPFTVPPYTMQDQILYTESQLNEYARELEFSDAYPVKTILVGHSVGAYIVMEMLRRRHAKQPSSGTNLKVVQGILLFPTIIDLAKSPSGRIMDPLLRIPYAAVLAGSIVWLVGFLLPRVLLYNFLTWILFFPSWAAATATSFIKSSHGVAQTIYLAHQEMEHIKEDRWGEEVWGAEGMQSPKLRLLFGKNDGLVGAKIQSEIIRTRSPESDAPEVWRPQVSSERIPHAFCVSEKHSEKVAGIVGKWIGEVL